MYFWLVRIFSSILIQYPCLLLFDSNVSPILPCLIFSHRCIIHCPSGCSLCGTLLIQKAAAFSENLSKEIALLRLKQIVNDTSVVSYLERMVLSSYTFKIYKNNNRKQISHLKYLQIASKYYFYHSVFCVVICLLHPNLQAEDLKFTEVSSVLLVQCNGTD